MLLQTLSQLENPRMLHVDGDTILERIEGRRENFVPLHTTDLVDFLVQHPALREGQSETFRQVTSIILALLHHLYRQRHERLSYIYTSLDPDRDRLLLSVPTPHERERLVDELVDKTKDALHRANYVKLTEQDMREAMQAASQWGVRMRVDFRRLKRLEVYARGSVIGERHFRNWRKLFREDSVKVPLYQRLVVIFQVEEESRSAQFDPRRVYLRMFKNVPQQDVDMMLPATGIQMSWLDHSKIVVPSLYAAGITLWRFLRNVFLLAFFGVFKTLAMVLLVLFAIGFGLKSMFTYRTNTKRRYMLSMAQSLYYQNLDNNAGVLSRLLEEGEQQEASEAILAYFVLVKLMDSRNSSSLREIDDKCEIILREATGIDVDFDVHGTIENLMHLGIVTVDRDGWKAVSLDTALLHLDRAWDSWFGELRQE